MSSVQTLIDVNGGVATLNENVLNNICDKINGRPVAVISTAGKYRQGKTFWNNVLLKGLISDTSSFKPDEEIGGTGAFAFKCGQNRDTRGLTVYPEVFIRKDREGKEVAVVLIDTQGTFDLESDTKDSQIIFALSLLLSSKKIYNVNKNIDSKDLDTLSIFIAFSNLNNSDDSRIGQDFLFLMRDSIAPFGKAGGDAYLASLKRNAKKNAQIQNFVSNIEAAFDKVQCFTIPRPEEAVMNGTHSVLAKDCGADFLANLCSCANMILHDLSAKKLNGAPLNGNSFREYVKNIVKHISQKDLQGMGSALEATALLFFDRARHSAIDHLRTQLEQTASTSTPLAPADFDSKVDAALNSALKLYNATQRYGSQTQKVDELRKIESELKAQCSERKKQNRDLYRINVLDQAQQEALKAYELGMKENQNDILSQVVLQATNESRFGNLSERNTKCRKEALQLYDSRARMFRGENIFMIRRKDLISKITESFVDKESRAAGQCILASIRDLVDELAAQHRQHFKANSAKIRDLTSRDREIELAQLSTKTMKCSRVSALIKDLCNAFSCLTANELKKVIDAKLDQQLGALNAGIEAEFKAEVDQRLVINRLNETMRQVEAECQRSERSQSLENKQLMACAQEIQERIRAMQKSTIDRMQAASDNANEVQSLNAELEDKNREIQMLKDKLREATSKARRNANALDLIDRAKIRIILNTAGKQAGVEAKKQLENALDEHNSVTEIADFVSNQLCAFLHEDWRCIAGFDLAIGAQFDRSIHISVDKFSLYAFLLD